MLCELNDRFAQPELERKVVDIACHLIMLMRKFSGQTV